MLDRVYSTTAPLLRPRPAVSLGVFVSGLLVGMFAGIVLTLTIMAAVVFP